MAEFREIGSKIIKIDVLDSTNDEMKRRLEAANKPESGLVIITEKQTSGRGLGKNIWDSQEGANLTFSMLLRPHFLKAAQQFNLNMAISLGVYELVKFYFEDRPVKIKWPNDIYVGDKKIGGILINHSVSGDQLLDSIVGIGLNVNQTRFSEELPNPVSMKQLSGYSFDLDDILRNMLTHLNNYYGLIKKEQFLEFREAYKYALFGYYKWLKFNKSGRIIIARIVGISEMGLLRLETESKESMECDLKEIEFIV